MNIMEYDIQGRQARIHLVAIEHSTQNSVCHNPHSSHMLIMISSQRCWYCLLLSAKVIPDISISCPQSTLDTAQWVIQLGLPTPDVPPVGLTAPPVSTIPGERSSGETLGPVGGGCEQVVR